MHERQERHQSRRNETRRRRFGRFLFWNLLGSAVITVPLALLGSPAVTLGFATLLVFMSIVLAAYFALLRVE